MTYDEVLKSARGNMGPYCKVCPVCNGAACKNQMPGPGAKGVGDNAVRNYQKWQEIRVNMDTIHENKPIDTSVELFGRTFKYPFFAGPVGAMTLHYGEKYDDLAYNNLLVDACAKGGIAAFTGDGTNAKDRITYLCIVFNVFLQQLFCRKTEPCPNNKSSTLLSALSFCFLYNFISSDIFCFHFSLISKINHSFQTIFHTHLTGGFKSAVI